MLSGTAQVRITVGHGPDSRTGRVWVLLEPDTSRPADPAVWFEPPLTQDDARRAAEHIVAQLPWFWLALGQVEAVSLA